MSFKNLNVREARSKQGEGYSVTSTSDRFQNSSWAIPAGAVNVPLLHRDEHTGQMMPNRQFLDVMRANFPSDAKLLIGCQVGGRSAQAAQFLTLAGFNDVANVLGGYDGARDPMTGESETRGGSRRTCRRRLAARGPRIRRPARQARRAGTRGRVIARAFHGWERRLASVATDRVVRPFEWGIEWIDPAAGGGRGSGGVPRDVGGRGRRRQRTVLRHGTPPTTTSSTAIG